MFGTYVIRKMAVMWQRRRDEGGQYLVVVALLACVLLGAAGLVAGLSITYIQRQFAQSAAGPAVPAAIVQTSETRQVALAALPDTEAGNPSPIMVSLQLTQLPAPLSGLMGDTGKPLGGISNALRGPQVTAVKPAKPLQAGSRPKIACNSETQGPTVLVLDGYAPGSCLSSDPGSLSAIGNVSLDAPNGTITVDSASSSAAQFTGNIAVTTASDQPMAIVGGYSAFGDVTINPTPATHSQPVADPLAELPAPAIPWVSPPVSCTPPSSTTNPDGTLASATYSPCHYSTDLSLQGNETVNFNAGQYIFDLPLNYAGNQSLSFGSGNYIFSKGLSISGNSSVAFGDGTNPGTYVFEGGTQGALSLIGNQAVTFGPGTYIFEGGDFTLSGNPALNGNGVLLYFMKDANGDDSALKETGNPSMFLTPPTSGTYAGIVIFQAHPSLTPTYAARTHAPNCGGGGSCHSISSDDTFQLIGNPTLSTSPLSTAQGSTTGIIYLPRGILELTGNADANITFIVDQLQMAGNAAVTVEGYSGPYWPGAGGGDGAGWQGQQGRQGWQGWQGWPRLQTTKKAK